MLSKAIMIAATTHLGQRDRGGASYILHPLRIMMRLRTDDEELQCIAVLHDAVEDSEHCTLEYLRGEGFSERVLKGLELMTHEKGSDYFSYIEKMRYNKDALMVKREDLRDNSDITRLKGLRQKDHDRLMKYNVAFTMVTDFLKAL